MIAAAANKSALAAITVKNITANTTIFSDDGFEDDTVGNHPNAPTAGTWNTPATTTTGSSVVNDAAPGAYDGVNYLKIDNGPNSAANTAQSDAIFTAPIATGETLKASFAFEYVSTGSSSAAFRLMDASNSVRAIVIAEPDYNVANYYVIAGSTSSAPKVFSSLPVNTGHWQTIDIQYTYGSSDLTLTVDGTSETLASAIRSGTTALGGIRFNHASTGTIYYLDGLPTPTLAGDYNGDHVVDAADYVVWRQSPTTVGGGDPAGYNAWRAAFGNTSGAGSSLGSAAVPEPITCGLLILGCACLSLVRPNSFRAIRKVNR
jgi:hypothetical protein